MKGHGTNLANVVISNYAVLESAAFADPEFESEDGIGDFLDYAGTIGVVADTVEIYALVFADVCLENIAQLAIHTLSTNCGHPARLANRRPFFLLLCLLCFPLRPLLFVLCPVRLFLSRSDSTSTVSFRSSLVAACS